MCSCLDCGRKPEEEQQWDQEVMKWNRHVYFKTCTPHIQFPSLHMKTSCRGHSSLPTSLSLRGTDVHFQGQRPSEPGNWLHCSCSFVQMPSFGTVGGGEGETGVCWLSATLLPLLSSTSYWCPKGPGLEVSPSEVTGSNFIWWIWRSSALRGPSGQTYWNPNKWACGGWVGGGY